MSSFVINVNIIINSIMIFTLFVLAFVPFGLVPARPVSLTEDVAITTSLLANPVILGRNPHYALSKRAGPFGEHLPPPANLVPTNPELTNPEPNTGQNSRRKPSTTVRSTSQALTSNASTSEASTSEPSTSKPSTSKPTKPQITWSNDYGTNLVRKWPVLFLPWGSKHKNWDSSMCETLSRHYPSCTSANAKIAMEPKGRARWAAMGPAYTVVTDMKPVIWDKKQVFAGYEHLAKADPVKPVEPLVDGDLKPLTKALDAKPVVKEPQSRPLYISRDGIIRSSPPKAHPPPEEEYRYQKSRKETRKRLNDLLRGSYSHTPEERQAIRDQLSHWVPNEDLRQKERDAWWAQQRWRKPRDRQPWPVEPLPPFPPPKPEPKPKIGLGELMCYYCARVFIPSAF